MGGIQIQIQQRSIFQQDHRRFITSDPHTLEIDGSEGAEKLDEARKTLRERQTKDVVSNRLTVEWFCFGNQWCGFSTDEIRQRQFNPEEAHMNV